jgi:hypothetical protein
MRLRISSKEDFWAGLMFMGFGVAALWISQDYQMGTARRMGPAYFPTGIGYILVSFGVCILLRSFWTVGEGISKWAWRPLLMMIVGLIAFALLKDDLGLIVAVMGLVVAASFADREQKNIKEIALLAVLLAAGSAALFVWGLGLPFKLWWGA